MQAGRRGEGAGRGVGGGGGGAGEAAPPCWGHADTGWGRGGPCWPAQPRRKCPFLARQLAGSPAARRWRGLICIEVTGMPPIAAPPSGPGNFEKAQARRPALVSPGARREPGGPPLCSAGHSRSPKQHGFQPRVLASAAARTAGRGRPSWSGPAPPSGDGSSHLRRN